MVKTVKLQVSEDLFKMIKELAKKERKTPEEYISDLIIERHGKI